MRVRYVQQQPPLEIQMKPDESYDRFLAGLRSRLGEPLPGRHAQFEMAPVGRQHPDLASIEGKTCREAAVLALFYPNDSTDVRSVDPASLLLTIRPDGMPDHGGQISFPGGRREENEDLEETALRETEEEMGIPRQNIEILGRLTPLYIPPSGFCVYPFLGALTQTPDLSIVSEEVAGAFGVSVMDLTDPGARRRTKRTIRDQIVEVPYFDLKGEFVWGATAMILAELAAIISEIA